MYNKEAVEERRGCSGISCRFGVVGLVGVDDEQSGSPERALHLVITNRLKARTFWSGLIERKLNSLKGGEVVQVVVALGVVGLRRVDEEQSGSPEMSSMAVAARSDLQMKIALNFQGSEF